ncbi:pectinesterase family protein [Paenibacillus sp. HB172176]|uniref:pectinesterase family protein n=1 Tax=Paenibacillus sp. HB172176 TaxID=2493690 RepID=UPI00143B4642|nr:pectinesterase family protein [Paenibacillus sp. HB172176]
MKDEALVKLHFTVAADGSGEYTTIQAAVDAIPPNLSERAMIRVRSGEYREKLFIDGKKLSLIGEGAEKTVIRWDDYALKAFLDGELYNTFHSYTAFIGGDDFIAEGLSFVNAAGPGHKVGQAVAAYVDGDRAVFRRCRFIASQDTLFTGPLPLYPIDRPTFGGPREGLPRRASRQYYEDCYMEGDVDFIFGSATAVFHRCEIFSRRRLTEGDGGQSVEAPETSVHGWLTAASTPEEAANGYVFLSCRLTGDAPPQSVFLGRPWREHAHTAFVDCWMGAHIRAEGWDDWNKPDVERTVRYMEHGSSGPGAVTGSPGMRVGWSRRLTEGKAAALTPASVLSGEDGWNPVE